MKYAFRRISWGKCVWRLEDCLHNNYIAINFSSYFPFFESIFLHFLRILIDFYRTTTLGHPIHWVHFPIYQVRTTSLDSDFCRVSTVVYSTVHVYSSLQENGDVCTALYMLSDELREPLLGIYGGTAYMYISCLRGEWS